MTGKRLIRVFVPPLVVMLAHAEKERGRPLSEPEVIEIRDRCVCMMMDESAAVALLRTRGYDDLDPEHAWEQWRAVRTELVEG